MANYLCPIYPGCIGGFYLFKVLIKWSLETILQESLALWKLMLLTVSLGETPFTQIINDVSSGPLY